MRDNTLSNLPPKGTYDWFPDQFKVRKYIFDTWRSVCKKYGYQEYMTPLVESAALYRAKSGEDLGGKELMTVIDKAGRELAIRPEMTPSVTRMVTRIYEGSPKPIRLFSIANFLRNEKPQRGRNREFWQLNYDIFGAEGVDADIEVLLVALDIMLTFSPPADAFVLNINNRKIIDQILAPILTRTPELKIEIVRIMDKWEKLDQTQLVKRFNEIGLQADELDRIDKFMSCGSEQQLLESFPEIAQNQGYIETTQILQVAQALSYESYIKFKPNVVRGFDYYDGMIFEVFDQNPENRRSLFGGGRYNGLAGLFGKNSFPAVGAAPGDETTKLFLESWGVVQKIPNDATERLYIPILADSVRAAAYRVAKSLRNEGLVVEMGTSIEKVGSSLGYANRIGFDKVVILGEDELSQSHYKVKQLSTGEETVVTIL